MLNIARDENSNGTSCSSIIGLPYLNIVVTKQKQ
jgi:hypothetical protein